MVTCWSPLDSDLSIEVLKADLKEMRTNLQEERWHNEDLKKELLALQESLKIKEAGQEEMVPQVRALGLSRS